MPDLAMHAYLPRVGSRWVHVGGHGIEATGLVLEIVTRPERGRSGVWAIYPELGDTTPRRYELPWNTSGFYQETNVNAEEPHA